MNDERPSLANITGNGNSRGTSSFYRTHGNLSNTSLESEALLDHRDHPTIRTRRPSAPLTSMYQPRASQPYVSSPQHLKSSAFSGRAKLSHTRPHPLDELVAAHEQQLWRRKRKFWPAPQIVC
jgi:magnesium transporter